MFGRAYSNFLCQCNIYPSTGFALYLDVVLLLEPKESKSESASLTQGCFLFNFRSYAFCACVCAYQTLDFPSQSQAPVTLRMANMERSPKRRKGSNHNIFPYRENPIGPIPAYNRPIFVFHSQLCCDDSAQGSPHPSGGDFNLMSFVVGGDGSGTVVSLSAVSLGKNTRSGVPRNLEP